MIGPTPALTLYDKAGVIVTTERLGGVTRAVRRAREAVESGGWREPVAVTGPGGPPEL